MPRPRKDQRCNDVSPGSFAPVLCERKLGHAGEHSAGKIRWSG